jgi:hypothetical protein
MRISSLLYRLSRASRDVEAVTSGDPEKVVRRGKDKIVGRILARVGFWRRLWR